MRFVDVIERGVIIERDDLLGDDWPVGFVDFGVPIERLLQAVRPVMKRAVDAGGVRARRVMPNVRMEAIEVQLKREGMPLPSEDEFQGVMEQAWNDVKPQRRRANASAGRTIIPPKPKKPGQPPAGVEIKDDERWSDQFNMAVPKGQDGDKMEEAGKNGWPLSMMSGAKFRKRGEAGYTLAYMSKNKYAPERYGTPESHGLGDNQEVNEDPEPEMDPNPTLAEAVEDALD